MCLTKSSWYRLSCLASSRDHTLVRSPQVLKSRSLQWKNEGQYPADAGSIPINRKKNRFKDILPCKPVQLFWTFLNITLVKYSLNQVSLH